MVIDLPIDPSFRASDDDRENVVAVLRDQMVAGRLSSAELDERVGLAYAGRTWDDLRRIVLDLPVTIRFADERVPAQSAPPYPVYRPRPRRRPLPAFIVLACLALIVLSDRMISLAPLIAFAVLIAVIAFFASGCGRRF